MTKEIYENLISHPKSMLIAPAWYGKTYTIVECVKLIEWKALILTHTHAWVAVLKERLKASWISNTKYHIETISWYALKYVDAFYTWNDIPDQSDKKFFEAIIKKALLLFSSEQIQYIISLSYKHLFIDEYQDCSLDQHYIIKELSKVLYTHIIGDPMQGIFDFKWWHTVNLDDSSQFEGFYSNRFELYKPHRRIKAGNETLGDHIKEIRDKLIKNESINFTDYKWINLHLTQDIYTEKYWTIMALIKKNNSLLIIDSNSKNINTRIQFVQRFRWACSIIEAIDDKDFYKLSKHIDELIGISWDGQIKDQLFNFLCDSWIFAKTEIKKRINKTWLIKKEWLTQNNLIHYYGAYVSSPSFYLLAELLHQISTLENIKFYRKDLFHTLLNALKEAHSAWTTVLESMKKRRNTIRRIGRKIYWRSIGTTLLTKWLEFETVLILNADQFENKKHLYVALSRASKELHVFSKKEIISFP